MNERPISWSYTALKQFQTCPKQYYHQRVKRDVPFTSSPDTEYGIKAHKAAEEYMRDGKPLPPEFKFMKEQLDELAQIPGDHFHEHKLALNSKLRCCDYRDRWAWFRGIADLLIISPDRKSAHIIDYKFGKIKNADTRQLELLALAVFKTYPTVERVRAGLLFCKDHKLIPTKYKEADAMMLWGNWLPEVERLEAAYKNDVWNPSPSGLCRGWCPVESCPHWEPKR